MVDAVVQRKNMVESQVRPSDVTDRRIMRAMLDVPRERFVPSHMQPLAYMDENVSLGGKPPAVRGLMAPRVFARLIQIADIEPSDVILDLGCATGYSAAILAQMAETVVALERDTAMAEQAQTVLADLGIDNVVVVTGDLTYGYGGESPYDVIVVEGQVEAVPEDILDQLKDGGRLVAVVAEDDGVSRAVVWRRLGQTYDRRAVFEASAPVLAGFERPKSFVF